MESMKRWAIMQPDMHLASHWFLWYTELQSPTERNLPTVLSRSLLMSMSAQRSCCLRSPVPRRDLDCARRILPCAEVPLRRDLSRPDSRLARRLRGTSPSCAQAQRGEDHQARQCAEGGLPGGESGHAQSLVERFDIEPYSDFSAK